MLKIHFDGLNYGYLRISRVSQFFKNYSNFLHLYLTIQRRRLIPIFKENLIIHPFFWPKTHFDSLNIDRVGQILKLSSVSSIPP